MADRLKREMGNGFVAAGIFLAIRFLLMLCLPYRVFIGYGDLINFFRVAEIPGWPFLDYWVEFPPIFPFLSEIIYRLSNGVEMVYVYTLAGVFTLFDAGSLVLFQKLAKKIDSDEWAVKKLLFYAIVLALFPYGWWYFEALVVFFVLLSLLFLIQKKTLSLGFTAAVGTLIKVFPILVLIPVWLNCRRRDFIYILTISIVIISAVIGGLWLFSPDFTTSSVMSQYSKGSWETVWAMFDGNKGTGNFGPLSDRLDPALAYAARVYPSKISPIMIVGLAGGVGLLVMRKFKNFSARGYFALWGLSWSLLVIASPGWSPQWVLMILPICLLAFPLNQGLLINASLLLINFAEWPLIISRGRLDLLWVTISVRLLIHILLTILFTRICMTQNDELQVMLE